MRLLAVILYFVCHGALSQVSFQKTFGSVHSDQANDIIQAYDSSYVVVGSSSLTGYSSDVYILKIDSLGNYLWSKYYGGNNVEVGNKILQTPDSGYIITGYTNSIGAGGYDVYLLKIDKDGEFEWEQTYGGSDWDMGHSINIMPDSGYVIVGQTYSFGAGNSDGYIIRTDKNGNLIWQSTSGTAGEDIFYDLYTTTFLNFMIVGSTDGMGVGGKDVYVARYSQTGAEIWTTSHGGPLDDEGRVIQPQFSHYNIVGSTESYGLGGSDIYLLGVDGAGAFLYDDTKGSTEDEVGMDMARRPFDWMFMVGDIYVPTDGSNNYVGYYTNSLGGVISSFSDGGNNNEHCTGVAYTHDDSFILCGNTESFNFGGSDIYVIKLGPEPYTNNSYNLDGQFYDFTDIEDVSESFDVKVYPNPCADYISIESLERIAKVEVYDINGRLMPTANYKSIDCRGWSSGIYQLVIESDNGRKVYRKVSVNH